MKAVYNTTPNMEPLITIQILNWNRANETLQAIDSALCQSYKNIEIVIVDNGSSDGSVKLIHQNYPNLKLIELGKNYGCPGGRNKGIPFCNGDYIFYLDNDGVLHKDAVKNAYKAITASPDIGVVTGNIYEFHHRSEIDTSCKIRNDSKYFYNNFQGGICLHDKRIYSKVGLYPEHFMYGAEEYYLTLRLFNENIQIVKDESVILWHVRSNIARNRGTELKYAYFNKLYISAMLFPTVDAMKFLLYFIPAYIYYSYKEGYLKIFLKNYIKTFIITIKQGISARNPIRKEAFQRFKKFQPQTIK